MPSRDRYASVFMSSLYSGVQAMTEIDAKALMQHPMHGNCDCMECNKNRVMTGLAEALRKVRDQERPDIGFIYMKRNAVEALRRYNLEKK